MARHTNQPGSENFFGLCEYFTIYSDHDLGAAIEAANTLNSNKQYGNFKLAMDMPATIDLNALPSPRLRSSRFFSYLGALFLLCLGAAHIDVQAQQLPVASCASPGWIFSTGVNANTGAQLAQNAAEPRWQYASHAIENTDTYIAPTTWQTPVVKRLTTFHPWYWSNQGSAEWITPNTAFSATKYSYYRFRFELDGAQDPAAFQVGLNFEADDQVISVFVNTTKVNDGAIGGGFLPPNGTGQRLTRSNQYTISQGWQAGTNEIVLLVRNDGQSTLTTATPYGGVLVQGLAMCGGARVTKAFSPSQVQAGGASTLTIHVDNLTVPARPAQNLLVKDDLPAPLEIAGIPTTTCQNATLTGAIGDTSVTLGRSATAEATADMLPTGGCDITVPVRWPTSAAAQCVGNSIVNTITPGTGVGGQFSTALGFAATPATASLLCQPPSLVLNVQTAGAAGGPFAYTLAGTGQTTGSASTAAAKPSTTCAIQRRC